MRSLRHIAMTWLVLSTGYAAYAQTTWHVDDDCSAPGAGTEDDPFCTIQDGVNASDNGDTVLVAPGTYTGDGNRDISLFGKTIILKSSDGPDATTIDSEAGPGNIHRGFFLVHGETLESVIEGFTITGGYLIGVTDGVGEGGGGAAIYIRGSSPTIRNCIMRENISATLNPPFPVDGRGGGIYIDGGSNAVIEYCIIVNNLADRRGGGMYVGYEKSAVSIRNCLVGHNSSGGAGSFPGGGLYLTFGQFPITGTLIIGNVSGASGGGMAAEGSEPTLTNCILWRNEAGPLFDGPQMSIGGFSSVAIAYSAVQDGLAGVANFGELDWGPGMIETDPLFFDPENGDFRFLHGSPCIDAGNNLAVPEGAVTDLDGGPRFLDDPNTRDTGNPDPGAPELPIVDMGPYEFGHLDCNNNDTPDTTDLADGSSDDCNTNDIPDECEVDCNGNDRPDSCDLSAGSSEDCNGNEIPDECDIASGVSPDCNQNAIPDACDLASGASQDCGGEGIPDECPENPGVIVISQPVDLQVQPGDLAFFSVGAEGTLLEYQWRKDGVELEDNERIAGTQAATLVIFEAVPSDAGAYDCVVTDFFGACALSNPATLTVGAPCPADVNGDGAVGPVDLAMLLAAWGPCPDEGACSADLNADATVNPFDLAQLLATWGPCP